MILKKRSAFTLIELLISIGILGVLAGVVIAVINPERKRAQANDAVLSRALGDIAASIEAYKNIEGTYPATSALLLPYLSSGFTSTASGFTNSSISVGGVKGGIIYWNLGKLCLDAKSNVDLTKYLQWRLGTGVNIVSVDCASL